MAQTVVDHIVAIEWEMFAAVPNAGGKAPCQDDRVTFEIMRRSQAEAWPVEVLESYRSDLRAARRQGLNLMTVKYARMMEFTHPDEYERIQDQLPAVDEHTRALIDEVVAVHRVWDDEVAARYPRVRSRGRPGSSRQDDGAHTSAETYMRGELSTFSPHTMELYHRFTMEARAAGINLAQTILENTARFYGYASLDEAEKAL